MAEEFDRFFENLGQKPRRKPIDRVRGLKRLDLLSNGAEILIAEEQGKPAGYVLYFLSASIVPMERIFNVPDVFVRKAFRGKGVGKLMMEELAQRARKRKVTSILWTVYDRNPRALEFYLKLGAKPISDEIVMRWKVSKR